MLMLTPSRDLPLCFPGSHPKLHDRRTTPARFLAHPTIHHESTFNSRLCLTGFSPTHRALCRQDPKPKDPLPPRDFRVSSGNIGRCLYSGRYSLEQNPVLDPKLTVCHSLGPIRRPCHPSWGRLSSVDHFLHNTGR